MQPRRASPVRCEAARHRGANAARGPKDSERTYGRAGGSGLHGAAYDAWLEVRQGEAATVAATARQDRPMARGLALGRGLAVVATARWDANRGKRARARTRATVVARSSRPEHGAPTTATAAAAMVTYAGPAPEGPQRPERTAIGISFPTPARRDSGVPPPT